MVIGGGGRGDMQLVILVDIQEDLNALQRHKQTQEYRERFRALALEYAYPDIIDHLEFQDDINHIDFVGPIEVKLELWELNGDLPKRSSHPTYISSAENNKR